VSQRSGNADAVEERGALQQCREQIARLEKRLALLLEDQQRQEHINDNHRTLLYKVTREYEVLLEHNKRLAGELHCKNLYLSGVIERSPTPMFTLDAALRLASGNPRTVQFFGLELSQGRVLEDVFPPQVCEMLRCHAQRAMANDSVEVFKTYYDASTLQEAGRQDAQSRLLEFTLFQVPHVSGEEAGLCCLAHDLNPAREELAERIMQSQLVELGALSAGIAHEVNNPINGVMNYLELCLDFIPQQQTPQEQELAEYLQRAQKLAGRVAGVVQAMLGMAGQRDEQPTECSIEGILEDALLLLRYELRRNDIELHLGDGVSLPPFVCRRLEIVQILQNLVINAIQAHAGAPQDQDAQRAIWLDYGLDQKGKALRITVRDNGSGLEAGQMSRLFHPFVTTKEQGTGLGLYLSRQYAQRNGGDIVAANAPAGGAVFTVTLPLSSGAHGRDGRQQAFNQD